MDLQDQLKTYSQTTSPVPKRKWKKLLMNYTFEPMICKFEKEKEKATTIIEGYEGSDEDLKPQRN
jgi:translation initiation factor 1